MSLFSQLWITFVGSDSRLTIEDDREIRSKYFTTRNLIVPKNKNFQDDALGYMTMGVNYVTRKYETKHLNFI